MPLSMPQVDEHPEGEVRALFAKARELTQDKKGLFGKPQRYLVILTPGRMMLKMACPKPGSMPDATVKPIEAMFAHKSSQKIVVIAFNDVVQLIGNNQQIDNQALNREIPFYGILLGMAYVGHSVVIFEGHPSALVGALRDATVLLVDAAMTPFLQPDWAEVAFKTMQKPDVRVLHANGKIDRIVPGKVSPKAAVLPYTDTKANVASAENLVKQGNTLLSQRNVTGAIQKYTDAIAADPNYAVAYLYRASVYLVTNAPARALEDCTAAITLRPDFGEAYANRAVANLHLKNYAEAIKDSTQAIQINRTLIGAYIARANACEAQNNTAGARADYQNILKIDPNNALARQALQRLR